MDTAGKTLVSVDFLDPETRIMTAFYELQETADWYHPTEVLDRPRPSCSLLLAICEIYLGTARGAERERLESVRSKLARAVRFAEAAREQRRKDRERGAGKPRRGGRMKP